MEKKREIFGVIIGFELDNNTLKKYYRDEERMKKVLIIGGLGFIGSSLASAYSDFR